jgi:hypothetical protein
MSEDVQTSYFNWICDLVGGWDRRELLYFLHSRPFEYTYMMDRNRADDGIDLRYRFGYEQGLPDPVVAAYLDKRDCSMLEMMTALALRCEEDVMADPDAGNRTAEWFNGMLESMGLSDMTDGRFDEHTASDAVDRLLSHRYSPDGKGGLFWIPQETTGERRDMRKYEIWYQMMWYLDNIITEE